MSADVSNDDLCLRLANGTHLVVPNSLKAITTYVVLEQERWFEKEYGFLQHLLAPGMVAIDIGANLGIFSVAMARLVGPGGKVIAYEPTSDTRARLERSKAVNGAGNLTVLASALSDTEREGKIVFGTSSELNRLSDAGGDGEAVHLTSLDIERQRHGWGQVDFIKIDAEGEELRILRGGAQFLAETAPLVMFEITSGTAFDPALGTAFEAMGYELFRLLPDERHLVPFARDELDPFELNLFAATPERAKALAARGLLTRYRGPAPIGPEALPGLLAALRTQPFAQGFAGLFGGETAIDPAYAEALAAYGVWRDASQPLGGRHAALRMACDELKALVARAPTPARLVTLGRIALEAGQRALSNTALQQFLRALADGDMPDEPFVPAAARYEGLAPDGAVQDWLFAGTIEQLERGMKHSSLYVPALPQLDWLSQSRFASVEMERRRALSAAVRGQPASLRINLAKDQPGHLNGAAWAALMGGKP